MNKRIIFISLALALPLTVVAFPGGEGSRPQGHGTNKVERLAKMLDLNAEQKLKIEAVFKQQKEKYEAIKNETRVRMQDILTAEQMTKLDELKKQRKEKRQGRQTERNNKKQQRMLN